MYNIAGLHVEISRHEKILIFLYLNVISWGRLLLNSVPKIYSILQNNRRHLKVSHNQRINTAEFLRIPPSCGPRIFEACTRKLHKKAKNYASSRGPIEHLAIHLADSTRCLQDDSARGSAGSRMPTCGMSFMCDYNDMYVCIYVWSAQYERHNSPISRTRGHRVLQGAYHPYPNASRG